MPALLNSVACVTLASAHEEYKAAWQQPHPAAETAPYIHSKAEHSAAPCPEQLRTADADVALAHADFPSLRYRQVVGTRVTFIPTGHRHVRSQYELVRDSV